MVPVGGSADEKVELISIKMTWITTDCIDFDLLRQKVSKGEGMPPPPPNPLRFRAFQSFSFKLIPMTGACILSPLDEAEEQDLTCRH